jgi:hypothetical protein
LPAEGSVEGAEKELSGRVSKARGEIGKVSAGGSAGGVDWLNPTLGQNNPANPARSSGPRSMWIIPDILPP